jgi:hypothetical protein
MTKLLRKAFQKAAAVLPEYEQDELARRLLSAIESDEKRWDMLFADSATKLERLADRALEAHRAGLTEPLDPEKL